MNLIKKSILCGHVTLILFSPLPLLTIVASPAGPSFLPVVAPFEKKRIGVAYHQKKPHGNGRPPANSHIQNSQIQAIIKMFPIENFDCVQTVQGDIKISFILFFFSNNSNFFSYRFTQEWEMNLKPWLFLRNDVFYYFARNICKPEPSTEMFVNQFFMIQAQLV
jgi:hypothetical protein